MCTYSEPLVAVCTDNSEARYSGESGASRCRGSTWVCGSLLQIDDAFARWTQKKIHKISWAKLESPVFCDTENRKNSQNLGRTQNFTENTILVGKKKSKDGKYSKTRHKNKAKTNKTKLCMRQNMDQTCSQCLCVLQLSSFYSL